MAKFEAESSVNIKKEMEKKWNLFLLSWTHYKSDL